MAFRLTKDQLRQKETLRTTLREAEQAFESAITAYNQAAEQAAEWVQTTADSIRSEYDSKSERWQDSRTGQAVSVWLDEWEIAAGESHEDARSSRVGRLALDGVEDLGDAEHVGKDESRRMKDEANVS